MPKSLKKWKRSEKIVKIEKEKNRDKKGKKHKNVKK